MQQWQKRPTAPVVFHLFDLLWHDARDITGKTVLQRRARLEQIITPVPGIQVGGYVENRGIDLYRLAKEKGLEGIIAKRKTSTYRPGKRSPDWLKIKARPQQEFVVCGFTEGKGSRKHFEALLLGGYRNGRLRYFGHSGTGFSRSIASFNPLSLNPTPFNGNLAAFVRAIQFSDDAQRFASTICGPLYSDHGPAGTSTCSTNRQSTRSKDPSPR